MMWPDGVQYEGMWEDGERIGRGVLTLANGTRFEQFETANNVITER
jgi:hypothetical protein